MQAVGAGGVEINPIGMHEAITNPAGPEVTWLSDEWTELVAALAETLRRVRFDYSLTLAELFMERFIEPFHSWCQTHGLQSRYQAYGYPWLYTDLLDGYLVPDIPEGDQWLFNRGWVHTLSAAIDAIRYAIWNKSSFDAPGDGDVVLDLGEVRETSEVKLNGESQGVRWYGRHRYDLAGQLRPGANDLEIVVTTLAYNHCRAQKDDPMVQYWMSRSRQAGPLPAGLVGPVRLLPAAR